MAIKDALLFITVQEFKNWKGFNKLEFDEVTTPDNEIFRAISIASNNIDYLSGFNISPKWPENPITDFTDEIQTATAYYVNFLLTKDVNYLRGQSAISQGGITYSENNPDEPYFIPPEVFSCLRKIKQYLTFKGFSLKVEPYKSNNFLGNSGNENILERYLQIPNLQTNDSRVEIKQIHPKNTDTIVIIDTNNIKSLDNLTTKELAMKYFSPYDFGLSDSIDEPKRKLISLNENLPKIWTYQFQFNRFDTNKKTIRGAINELNAKSPDLSNYYNKSEIDEQLKEIEKDITDEQTLTINKLEKELKDEDIKINNELLLKQNITNNDLKTTNKTVIGAINEILEKPIPPSPSIDNWKDVAFNVSTTGFKNQAIVYDCKENRRYRIWFNLSPRQEKIILPDLYTFTDFVYSLGTGIPQTKIIFSTYIKFGGRLQLECIRNEHSDYFSWEDMNISGGNLWKLQELQE